MTDRSATATTMFKRDGADEGNTETALRGIDDSLEAVLRKARALAQATADASLHSVRFRAQPESNMSVAIDMTQASGHLADLFYCFHGDWGVAIELKAASDAERTWYVGTVQVQDAWATAKDSFDRIERLMREDIERDARGPAVWEDE